jgi:hypothetical protein
MPHSARFLAILVLVVLVAAVAACRDDTPAEATVEVEVPTDDTAPEELIGTWVLVEQSGQAPERVYTVTFTTTGDYIVQSETHAVVRQRYNLSGEDRIVVWDTLGVEEGRYVFDVSGDRLTLALPGGDVVSVLERRPDLLEGRHDLRPRVPVDPPPTTAPQDANGPVTPSPARDSQ